MTREEAISILKRKSTIPDDDYCWDEIEEAFDMAIEALENQKTGHWIETDMDIYECSECHKGLALLEKENYCPHCGAKMEGE